MFYVCVFRTILFKFDMVDCRWYIIGKIFTITLFHTFFFLSFSSFSFVFGVVTMLAGIAGLSLGAFLSQNLKKRFPRIDPIICAAGLFLSAPLLTGSTFVVTKNTTLCFIMLFFGQVALNLNWAIVADILLVRHSSYHFKTNLSNTPNNACLSLFFCLSKSFFFFTTSENNYDCEDYVL